MCVRHGQCASVVGRTKHCGLVVCTHRDKEEIIDGGKCIVQGLTLALNPGATVPTCRGVSTVPRT